MLVVLTASIGQLGIREEAGPTRLSSNVVNTNNNIMIKVLVVLPAIIGQLGITEEGGLFNLLDNIANNIQKRIDAAGRLRESSPIIYIFICGSKVILIGLEARCIV